MVYSEPPIINDLWMPSSIENPVDLVAGLRLIAHLIGQHAGGDFIIKLRSWNVLYAAQVLQAFPDTPWTFTVRDPLEIGVSVQRRPPTWMRALSAASNPFLPYAREHGPTDSPEEYFAAMFAAFCAAIEGVIDKNLLLIGYETLASSVPEKVCPHFGFFVTPGERRSIADIARFYAKSPFGINRLFQPDSAAKQAEATPALRAAVDSAARPSLDQLKRACNSFQYQTHEYIKRFRLHSIDQSRTLCAAG
jgi:hypothetical protein